MTGPVLPDAAYIAALASLPAMTAPRLHALVAAHGPAGAWSRVTRGALHARVLPGSRDESLALANRWRQRASSVDPAAVLHSHDAHGVQVAAGNDAIVPERLRGDIAPPPALFWVGDLAAVRAPAVAIIGTRRCTRAGGGIARELGRDLATAGVCVVSGLAVGIDGAAHRGALDAAAAPPVAVVGSGLDVVYPPQHRALWEAVASAGAVLSEAPLGAAPEAWRFPARNRLIAALADVVVVVESHARGGSLLTVDEADRRGVDVMAVPGSVRSSASAGTNALLAEGRAPARDVDDVLIALGLNQIDRRARGPAALERLEASELAVLEAFEWQPVTPDHLALRTGLPLGEISRALTSLVDHGCVAVRGGWYEREEGRRA